MSPKVLPQKSEIVVLCQRLMDAAELDQRFGLVIEERSQGRLLLIGGRLIQPDQ